MNVVAFAVAAAAVFCGAAVQGTIGFGLAVVAAPLVALTEPDWAPQVTLLAALPMAIGVLVRDRGGFVWRRVRWVLLGRVPGTALGTWVLVHASSTVIAVVIAVTVLGAVGVSAYGWHVPITPASAFSIGVISAVTGTASSIGGPPLALLYQHEPADELRGSLASVFVFGVSLSLVAVTVAGEITAEHVLVAALLLPPLALGLAASSWLRRRVDPERFRRLVLAGCCASAFALLAQALFG